MLFSPFLIDSLNKDEYAGGTNATNPDADEKSSAAFLDSFWKNRKSNSKYQPKEPAPKKSKPNGLLVSLGKTKTRNVTDIEMKVIGIKHEAKYSNVDSSSLKPKEPEPVQSDTL